MSKSAENESIFVEITFLNDNQELIELFISKLVAILNETDIKNLSRYSEELWNTEAFFEALYKDSDTFNNF